MEGALAAGVHFESDDVVAALLVAFDYAERAGFARMLSEPLPDGRPDPVAAVLTEAVDGGATPLGAMLAAAWRAALGAAADGAEPESVRAAIRSLSPTRGVQVISNRVR
jgi:hypothetical protein